MNQNEGQVKKRGGARAGSGRKRMHESQKKVVTNISLSRAVNMRLKELAADGTHGNAGNITEIALLGLFKKLDGGSI